MKIELKEFEVHDVLGAVWLATAILTYERYLNINSNDKQKREDYSFNQTEIRKLASKICSKKVHPARISQWANADHPNSSRNYLKKIGSSRRLTIPGEHNGVREMPNDLMNSDQVVFTNPYTDDQITYLSLLSWIKIDYKKLTEVMGYEHI